MDGPWGGDMLLPGPGAWERVLVFAGEWPERGRSVLSAAIVAVAVVAVAVIAGGRA